MRSYPSGRAPPPPSRLEGPHCAVLCLWSQMTQMFVSHHEMSDKLAEANRMGELGRKEEVKRIFGLDI